MLIVVGQCRVVRGVSPWFNVHDNRYTSALYFNIKPLVRIQEGTEQELRKLTLTEVVDVVQEQWPWEQALQRRVPDRKIDHKGYLILYYLR